MADADNILNTPLNTSDPNALKAEIQKARAAETKAKTQIYTLRGKKGLQAMAAAMGEDLPPQLSETPVYDDPEDSPQIQELRRQIALIREMEKQQQEQIEELRRKKAEREAGSVPKVQPSMVEMPRVHQANVESTNMPVQQASKVNLSKEPTNPPQVAKTPSYAAPANNPPQVAKTPSYAAPANNPPAVAKTPSYAAPNSTPAVSASPAAPSAAAPSPVSPRSTPLVSSKGPGVKRGKGNKVTMLAPESMDVKVLNCSWDSGASKSKKNNKAYTIQVTMNSVTWKIIRGDDALVDLSKRLSKAKAEGSALPPLVKKVVKQTQQAELAASVQTYLNHIQTSVVFAPKKDKTRASFLKFFAPFTSRDEGMGNYPGGTADPEGWFIWKLGLGD